MSELIRDASTFSAFVLLALYGLGRPGTLPFAGGLAGVAYLAERRCRARRDEEVLEAHGLRRIQVGRDVLYVERRDDA